jgi:PPOX class probable FMN-dependent enzyme
VPDFVTTEAELEAIYGLPAGPAVIKEIDHISDHYRRFIELSPFVVLATSGPEGLDCTPRGDPAGFVRVADRRTVLLPDRRGNNRIDTLRNIVRDPRIALLFLIPGVGRTLRINGRAAISVNRALCESFTMEGKVPRTRRWCGPSCGTCRAISPKATCPAAARS